MQPAVPGPPAWRRPRGASGPYGEVPFGKGPYDDGSSADDIGAFEQGSPFTRWALARYIVGRVVLDRLSRGLLVVAGVLLVLAGACAWGLHSTALGVLVLLLALAVLAMRAILRAVLRRLMGGAVFGPVEGQVRRIVDRSTSGVLRELRRVGLPGRLLTLPLLVPKLLFSRRETMARIRRFEVERAVPKAHRDELYLVLNQAAARGPGQ